MPIHVQTPEGNIGIAQVIGEGSVFVMYKTTSRTIRKDWFLVEPVTHTPNGIYFPSDKITSDTWKAMAAIQPEFIPKFGYIDNTDPYAETERGEE